MRAALAIAAREVAQRWVILLAALALGVVPVLALHLEYAMQSQRFLSPIALYVVSRAFWVVAFASGMSLLGRELHGGRLAFYFARPISGPAIAAGKVLGVAVVALGAELLVFAPGTNWDRCEIDGWVCNGLYLESVDGSMVAGVIGAQLFLGAGLVAGVLARSRSRWFAVDAAGLVAVTLLAIRVIDRLTALGERYVIHWNGRWQKTWELPEAVKPTVAEKIAFVQAEDRYDKAVDLLWSGLTVAAAVALIASAIAAIAIGRTDGRRAHAALSTTLWSSLFAVGATGLAVAQWGMP